MAIGMARDAAFEAHHRRYEDWFERHEAAYVSELLALRAFVPREGDGLEIGVGSGRFAGPLGVQVGVDPSPAMLHYAAKRGIEVVEGVGEALPFAADRFDHVLLVTTICFLDSPATMVAEARRVLRPGGRLVIGFIDRDSPLGQVYATHRHESVFYLEASFHSAEEVAAMLDDGGFRVDAWGQTLSHSPERMREIEPLRSGCGQCAFVVVSAINEG
ncbi:class I SAM-dependent methyltransferase [Guyparkeria halophila]|uniref:Class I SAM-dependent methyltransferase n=1 Tax=Guyparkeria halophila TaxID=47960 RepID=A0ABZ0YUM0_9GAMM|nr:class I SAM-dependent methyltransferase [Guyparkeria halophila]WQH15868.1 class I SAM-dependent methyltransferase [Guyparkeria halophila]